MGAPGLYSGFVKKANDLLSKDFLSEQKFSVSSTTIGGLTLTSALSKKGGLSFGDVAACYNYNNTLVDVKVDTNSQISTTLTFPNIIPSAKTIASFKLTDKDSGKLEVQYFHHHAALSSAVSLTQSPAIDVSASFGTPSFAFGLDAGYNTKSGNLVKYSAGISLQKPDSCSAVILGDKGDTIKASYVQHLDKGKRSTLVAEVSRRFSTNENTVTVGGSYRVDHLTTVKAKMNNNGVVNAVLQHEVIPKSLLTVSCELDTKAFDRAPRFGCALSLKY